MRNTILMLMTVGYSAVAFGAANHGNCNLDTPLTWTIGSTYVDGTTPNLIQGDGSPYVNGQSGISAVIKICEGTNDAVLQLSSTTRSFSVGFARPLATNSQTPSWASGTVSGQGILNIRNITFVPSGYTRADEYNFTARMGSQLPVKGTWNFRMWALSADASTTVDGAVTAANTPYQDSLVNVHHCPANSTATTGLCAGVVHETWLVSADAGGAGVSTETGLPLTQVGGLQNTQSRVVNAGQFSIPFSFVISTLL
jgi:hypothetical protein